MGIWSADKPCLWVRQDFLVFRFRSCGCAAGGSSLCGSQVGELQVDIRLVGEGSAEIGNRMCCRLTVKVSL